MAPSDGAIAIDNGTVLMMIPLIVLPIAAIAFARSGAAWRELGKGPFAIDRVLPPAPPPGPSHALTPPEGRFDPARTPDARGAQEAEARQMIEAKSYLRVLRGEAPLDVEAELAGLFEQPAAPAADAELRAEVRRLVIARNERRLRQGEEPLDVEAETERQLADFVGSS